MRSSLSNSHPNGQAAAPETTAAVSLLRLSGMAGLLFLLLTVMGAIQTPTVWPLWLTSRLVFQQDLRLLLTLLGVWIVAAWAWGRWSLPESGASRATVAALTVGLTVLCYAGHYLVLQGYDLTRDEQMVTFDAWIFSHGRLVWPISKEWHREAATLNLMFMLPVEQPVAWVSGYLPGNAALHALIGKVADPAWTAPLLTGLSMPLLWSIGRKLWPNDREAQTLPLILFALSGQVLLNGMTTYAMAAHLVFNLAWLRLFLADQRRADLLALALGFFATGLHQPIFHPMFVGPFLLLVLIDRRWGRLALFGLGYLAIGLFWLSWPGQIQALVSGPVAGTTANGTDYLTRLLEALAANSHNLTLMSANLLRFFTWQHAALLPLLCSAWPAIRRGGIPAALALGLALPVVIIAMILPWQGNGFGYRYIHPALGNAFLLSGFAWRELTPLRRSLRPVLAVSSVATLLALFPQWLTLSYARYAPFARASQTIDASGADYAVLQMSNGVSYGSVVFNRPDLGNRPIRLVAEAIADPSALARRICKPGTTVALATDAFFRPGAAYFATDWPDRANARLPALRAPYEAAGCRIVLLR